MYTSFARKLGILGFLCGLLLSSIAWQSHAAVEQRVYLPVVTLSPPVHVERADSLRTRSGSAYENGEIINDWGLPLYNVTIEAMFRKRSSPEQITTTTTVTAFPATLPGQRNAFRSQAIGDINTHWDFVRAYPTRWELASTRDHRAVTIVRAGPCTDSAEILCVELRNDYPRVLKSITILLGTAHIVYQYEWTVLDVSLMPQERRVVRLSRPYQWDRYSTWAAETWVEAQGELVL